MYFQPNRSAAFAISISRMNASCSRCGSWASGPGTNPCRKMPNSMGREDTTDKGVAMAHDVVITGGTVVDGTGGPAFRADVGIDGDRIVEVGKVDASGAGTVIDAEGRFVTPGFVDLHSHLDAQIGWDPLMSSSCWHGVTSVVMGNCGMTFAPVRPGAAPVLAGAMESVEDIPASCILDGLPWTWESYA